MGVVGTPDGIGLFRAWGRGILQEVRVPPLGKGEKHDRLNLPKFPGLEETFGITFDPNEISALSLNL